MPSISEHIDALDRMIEAGDTPVDKLRSQLAFIGREVASLEADYASLAENHSQLYQLHFKLKESQSKRGEDAWNIVQKEADECWKQLNKRMLDHNV